MSDIDPKLRKLVKYPAPEVATLEGNVSDALDRVATAATPLLAPTNLKTANYIASLDEEVICSGTFTVQLPVAAPKNAGRRVGVTVQSGTITVIPITGTVQFGTSDVLSDVGRYEYESNGAGGWTRQPVGSGGGGGVTSVTAGAGLTGGGVGAVTIDAANADGSLTIGANDIAVSAAIQSGAALGATSVQSVTAGDDTIIIGGTATNPTVAVDTDEIATEASVEELLAVVLDALLEETDVLLAIDQKLSVLSDEFPFEGA